VQEQGKVYPEARMEVLTSADIIEWYAEEGRRPRQGPPAHHPGPLSHWPSMKSPRLAYMKGLLEFLVKVVVRLLAASADARVPSDCRGQSSLAGDVAGFRAGFIPALAGLADGK
jgi:hypothetical protein